MVRLIEASLYLVIGIVWGAFTLEHHYGGHERTNYDRRHHGNTNPIPAPAIFVLNALTWPVVISFWIVVLFFTGIAIPALTGVYRIAVPSYRAHLRRIEEVDNSLERKIEQNYDAIYGKGERPPVIYSDKPALEEKRSRCGCGKANSCLCSKATSDCVNSRRNFITYCPQHGAVRFSYDTLTHISRRTTTEDPW